ncbi:prepilin peptidase [Arthrobacter sp. NPDC058288]|uniref:prepilin peptidase n=1 Tax=Arthrobacter sp. NPDC058288 TaxID=3346424 RepID=UPI0036EC9A67
MSLFTDAGATQPLFVLAAGVLGIVLGLVAEQVIAWTLPRLGSRPAVWVRITTAALTGALSALLASRFGISWDLPAYIVLAVLGVQLSRIDIAQKLLPNRIVLFLLLAGTTLLCIAAAAAPEWGALLRAVVSAAILFVVYLILAIISPNGIGMGDVKLAAPLGLYLGYLGWTQLFYGGTLGFVVGGFATFVLMRLKTKGTLSEVAYGPSMLAACLGVILSLP